MTNVLKFDRLSLRVVRDLAKFEVVFDKRVMALSSQFESQADDIHADLDIELTTQIDDYYCQILGEWENNDVAEWWHQMDFYGNGVRQL